MPVSVLNNRGRTDGNPFLNLDLINDQSGLGHFGLLNTSNWSFTGSGLGTTTDNTSVRLIPFSLPVRPNQRITATVEATEPSGDNHFGILNRFRAFGSLGTNVPQYYWARVVGNEIRISLTETTGTSTLVSFSPFIVSSGDVVVIEFDCTGDLLDATFDNQTTAQVVNINVNDSTIIDAGAFGFRSGFTASGVWWRSVLCEVF
jgi:hypothetical protein